MRRSLSVVAAVAIGQWTTVAKGEEDSPYLFNIPAELAANQSLAPGTDVVATLTVPDVDLAATTLRSTRDIELLAAGEGVVTVVLGERATLPGDPQPRYVAESFVVDFNEPVFEALLEDIERIHGGTPTRNQLVEFVHGFIGNKNYLRGFDLASRVASTGEGDCTEHAVLLAALARANSFHARVVIGVLLVGGEDSADGFGHAWTEIYDDGQWHVADATAPDRHSPDLREYYIPMISLENEGPGYGMDLARMTRVQPARISGISSAP